MAERIRDSVEARLKTWREGRFDLGIGIGVASGFVTVGAIGGSGRLEYVAVGAAVNLASRLCDRAAAGEILLDQKTVAEIHADGGSGRFQSRPPVELKGFSEAVAHFALAPVAPLRA